MKKIPLVVRKCLKKTSYLTKQQAENKSLLGKNGTVYRLHPYLCPVCTLWHLTKQPQ